MKNTLHSLLFLLILIWCSACSEIPPEIPPIETPSGTKNVLIEEFTGVQCSNCPFGAAKIQNLKSEYGDRVVAVTMHTYATSTLSAPLPDSRFDFRTEAADNIFENLGRASGLPAATINRVQFDGEDNLMLDPGQWASKVKEELDKTAQLDLGLQTQYDSINRQIRIDVTVRPFEEVPPEAQFRLHMGLIEDNMIDLQIDGSTVIEDYSHNHTLRQYLTNHLGDNIDQNFEDSDSWNKTYDYTLPPPDGWWQAENMHVFAFVTARMTADGPREVLQVTEKSFYK